MFDKEERQNKDRKSGVELQYVKNTVKEVSWFIYGLGIRNRPAL